MVSGRRKPFHPWMGITRQHQHVSVSRTPLLSSGCVRVDPLLASTSVQAAQRVVRNPFLNFEMCGATLSCCRKYRSALPLSVHSVTPLTRRTEPARWAGRAAVPSRVAGTCASCSPSRPHRLSVGVRGHRAEAHHRWRNCWPSRPPPPGGACRWPPPALPVHLAAGPPAAGGADARSASHAIGGRRQRLHYPSPLREHFSSSRLSPPRLALRGRPRGCARLPVAAAPRWAGGARHLVGAAVGRAPATGVPAHKGRRDWGLLS